MKLIKLKPKEFGLYRFKSFMFTNIHRMLMRVETEEGILQREATRHEINS